MRNLIEKGRSVFTPTGLAGEVIVSLAFRRKKIYKGKIAPAGTIFLELSVKTETRKMTIVEHIPGGQTKELEAAIEKQMLEKLCKNYNLRV